MKASIEMGTCRQLCDVLPSVSVISEHIKHQGWGRHRGRVLTREGEVIKGEQRRGWGKIRGEGVQAQKTNKERDR